MKKKTIIAHKKELALVVKRLLRKNEQVLIYFKDQGGLRKRLIAKDGICKVAYKGQSYRKWSRFSISCFLYDYVESSLNRGRRSHNWNYFDLDDKNILTKYKKHISVNKTLKSLIQHDKWDDIEPVQISYGKGFKEHIYIVETIK